MKNSLKGRIEFGNLINAKLLTDKGVTLSEDELREAMKATDKFSQSQFTKMMRK